MEKIYEVTGWQYGEFADNAGKIVHYAHLYCVSELSGDKDENRNYAGLKAHTFKCANSEVLKGVSEGDHVALYFNQYEKVNLIRKVKE